MRESRQRRCTAANSMNAAAKGAEAVGRRSKFELSDFPQAVAGAASPVGQRPAWQQVEQRLPLL
jgi:hypothetical protein